MGQTIIKISNSSPGLKRSTEAAVIEDIIASLSGTSYKENLVCQLASYSLKFGKKANLQKRLATLFDYTKITKAFFFYRLKFLCFHLQVLLPQST